MELAQGFIELLAIGIAVIRIYSVFYAGLHYATGDPFNWIRGRRESTEHNADFSRECTAKSVSPGGSGFSTTGKCERAEAEMSLEETQFGEVVPTR